ncbi:hypothetical protein J7M23_00825, partial [Candidatus Sumerlaeota bacterium]|nr:hypothetical protein [Candidatus Sumerlaeota bacterium]
MNKQNLSAFIMAFLLLFPGIMIKAGGTEDGIVVAEFTQLRVTGYTLPRDSFKIEYPEGNGTLFSWVGRAGDDGMLWAHCTLPSALPGNKALISVTAARYSRDIPVDFQICVRPPEGEWHRLHLGLKRAIKGSTWTWYSNNRAQILPSDGSFKTIIYDLSQLNGVPEEIKYIALDVSDADSTGKDTPGRRQGVKIKEIKVMLNSPQTKVKLGTIPGVIKDRWGKIGPMGYVEIINYSSQREQFKVYVNECEPLQTYIQSGSKIVEFVCDRSPSRVRVSKNGKIIFEKEIKPEAAKYIELKRETLSLIDLLKWKNAEAEKKDGYLEVKWQGKKGNDGTIAGTCTLNKALPVENIILQLLMERNNPRYPVEYRIGLKLQGEKNWFYVRQDTRMVMTEEKGYERCWTYWGGNEKFEIPQKGKVLVRICLGDLLRADNYFMTRPLAGNLQAIRLDLSDAEELGADNPGVSIGVKLHDVSIIKTVIWHPELWFPIFHGEIERLFSEDYLSWIEWYT